MGQVKGKSARARNAGGKEGKGTRKGARK